MPLMAPEATMVEDVVLEGTGMDGPAKGPGASRRGGFRQTGTLHSVYCTVELARVAVEVGKRATISGLGIEGLAALEAHFKVKLKEPALYVGSVGAVFVAERLKKGDSQVLKRMPVAGALGDGSQFGEVLQAMRRLRHPNIVKLLGEFRGSAEVSPAMSLLLERCLGSSLYSCLISTVDEEWQEPRGLHPDFVRRLAGEMASGLAHCHAQRLCHRDVKLENYLLAYPSNDAPLKLVDFCLASRFDPRTPMTRKVGTPYYAAPEVLAGCYDEKCDLWSLGVVLFLLCVGRAPFPGSTDDEVFRNVMGEPPLGDPIWDDQSLREPKVLVAELLNRNPKERPSAKQVLASSAWLRTGRRGACSCLWRAWAPR